jgi:uncharacterized protein YjiK
MARTYTEWVVTLCALLFQAACASSSDQPQGEAWPTDDSTYVFSEPDAEFTLTVDLEEISGLTFMEDGMLGAIQDEDGDLFIIDPSSGEIVEVRNFGEAGDYEGIELADSVLFILRSDGTVFMFDNWRAAEIGGREVQYDVPGRCDAEGIAYRRSMNRILIVCKEHPGKGYRGKKAIYAFDPTSGESSPSPAFLLEIDDFEYNVEEHPLNEAIRSMLSDRIDMSGFKPSGLAVHPRTDELFVLSGVTKALLRLDDTGAVTALWMLPVELFDQPEGIAINSNGDVYISNEAGDRKYATLLRFRERGGTLSDKSDAIPE